MSGEWSKAIDSVFQMRDEIAKIQGSSDRIEGQPSSVLTHDELVERLAKAAVVAGGYGANDKHINGEPLWIYHTTLAKQFLAMFKALQDG